MEGSVSDAVRRMAALAVTAGARGLVCSPQEVAAVRAEVGPGILLITPGIRPAGATSDDQARIATPVEAMKAGADLLVIGRPITKAADPGAAAAAIAASLRRGVLWVSSGAPRADLARWPRQPVGWSAGIVGQTREHSRQPG
jgi:orotidine-5'-phosphate decarboxylase